MYQQFFKRLIDAGIAAAVLCLLLPLFVAVALIIRSEDGGSAIFRQQRVGRNGQIFTIYKFRSMPAATPNVPSSVASSLQITNVGRIIRRTNIDELPQLLNVLLGHMSLIGPRPALPSQTSLLALRDERKIDRLRPGLTGLAQVNAYDGMPEAEKVEWESRYAANLSLTQDLHIIICTIGYLTRRPPVY